jgi:hypothetical protein
MLLITKEGVEALKERLSDSSEISKCRDELRRMLEIKEALLWRTEARSCCNIPWEVQGQLDSEIKLLEGALEALEEGDRMKAQEMLNEYVTHLDNGGDY